MFAAFDYKLLTIAVVILMISVLFLFPFILLPLGILVFNWSGIIINLIIIQIFIILVMRIILALRLKSRILDILLHPLSMAYIILICINSVFQARLGEGVYWKGRRYDVCDRDHLELINED